MLGPTYDDNYISRKMTSLQSSPTFAPPTPSYGYMQGYSMPPRHAPRMAPPPPPMYYDYDYGYPSYGGYGGYGGYSRPHYGGYGYGGYDAGYVPPRYRNYDPYLEDDVDLSYVPRYRPSRLSDTLTEIEKEKRRRSLSPSRIPTTRTTATTTTTTTLPPTDYLARHYNPGMLQDQVDKMRIRLKSMAYCLDPSGPVPDIVIPERSRRVDSSTDYGKKYTSGPKHLACVEFAGSTPQWKRRARARYPSEDPNKLSEMSREEVRDAEKSAERVPERLILKDKLSLKIHNYLSDTLNPERFQQYLKSYRTPGPSPSNAQVKSALPKYTSKYSSKSGASGVCSAKWEEPDTVYEPPSDEKKPYSKTTEVDEDDSKKERRKKKKSKEPEDLLAIGSTSLETPADVSSSVEASSTPVAPTTGTLVTEEPASAEPAPESAPEADTGLAEPESELDEKERKRLEKKKRKAEREAAAKAAMEAELAALEEAEAELARLEAESSSALKSDSKGESTTVSASAPEVKASETTDK